MDMMDAQQEKMLPFYSTDMDEDDDVCDILLKSLSEEESFPDSFAVLDSIMNFSMSASSSGDGSHLAFSKSNFLKSIIDPNLADAAAHFKGCTKEPLASGDQSISSSGDRGKPTAVSSPTAGDRPILGSPHSIRSKDYRRYESEAQRQQRLMKDAERHRRLYRNETEGQRLERKKKDAERHRRRYYEKKAKERRELSHK